MKFKKILLRGLGLDCILIIIFWLVPFILVPVTIQSRFKNELQILWIGMSYFQQQEDEENLLEQGTATNTTQNGDDNNDANDDGRLIFLARKSNENSTTDPNIIELNEELRDDW